MTNTSDYMPRADAQFNIFQDEFINYVQPNVGAAGTWNIPQADFDALLPLQMRWDAAWAIARNMDQRSHVDVVEKDDARDEYKTALRKFIKEFIVFNSRITDAQKEAMGINVPDDTRTPSPVPSTNPVMEIGTQDVGRHYISYKDEASNSSAKPNGVAYIEVVYKVGGSTPTSAEQCDNTETGSRSPLTITFAGSDTGKRVFYFARWVNTRSEAGPWSSLYSAIIT